VSVPPSPSEHPSPAPPVGADIHLPGPTILPLVCAVGITLIVIGTTLGWYVSLLGALILIPAVIRWIRDTRRDVASLPEEHEHL
jgi:hypothetical protein